jgi:hypothetical protein
MHDGLPPRLPQVGKRLLPQFRANRVIVQPLDLFRQPLATDVFDGVDDSS